MKIDTDEIIFKARKVAVGAGKTVSKFAETAEEKTGLIIDKAKLSCRIMELKGEIGELKKRVGDIVCRAHRGGKTSQTELDDLLFELDAKIDELEALKNKRTAGRVVCASCGRSCSSTVHFCAGCGAEL